MKLMPHVLSPKEENPQLVPVCNQGEFFVKPKEIEQGVVLEEVFTAAEVPKEID